MYKKLLLCLIFAAVSSGVFAMPHEPMDHCGIFEVALTGGGFKAPTDYTTYGVLRPSPAPAVFAGGILKNDPKYKFGGTVLLGYYFPNSTINIDASYTGVRNRDNDFANGNVVGLNMPSDTIFQAGSAGSDFHFDYDFANLEIGSLTRVNLNGLIINPQLGLSYARLKHDQSISYGLVRNAAGNLQAEIDVEHDSKFNGFGPSFNLDLNFVICQPIALFGNFRYNALVGKIRSSFYGDLDGVVFADISLECENTLVSLFQSELGIGYDFNFCNMFCGNIAVGYQLTKAVASGEMLNFSGTDTADITDNLFNTNIHGYFARLTMDFDV